VILLVGALSITAGTLYTGGPKPYGYAGLGEVFVFLFFGLVAVNGSYFVQLEAVSWGTVGLSIAVGLLATSILVVNNVRDIDSDRRAGKMTLAVRLGRGRTRTLFRLCLALAFAALVGTAVLDFALIGSLAGLVAVPVALRADRLVQTRTDGPSLNRALADTGLALGIFAVAVSAGVVLFG
jgi:1,4-dihydroxy-2-naphthoate octaprenyltransferase